MTTETAATYAEIGIPVNPFPGLRPFEFNESHLFFGRDGQSESLIEKLGRTHFLGVVGTSGSGKSSLVRAGLLPALLGGFMTSAGSNWRIAIMRPGNDPIGNLARALNGPDVFGSEIAENAALQTALAEATLRRGGRGLVDAVRQALVPENESLLVVADQFEEIFRFAKVAEGEQYQNEAAAFVKLLLEASRQREISIYVVLTMRSDYLGDCSKFWELPEAINESQYLIPRLTRDQLREAISGPVAVGGGKITPRLVNRLLNEVGDNQDQLPVLQHLLMRVWDESKEKQLEVDGKEGNATARKPHKEVHSGEALDLCCYDAVGGMANALSRHADEAFNDLPDDRSREVAEKLFKGLTEKGSDNREIRRPVTLGDICAMAGAGAAEVIAVIETFRQPGRSFLMPPAGVAINSESLIDISHESLIRGWTRLKDWVEEEARSSRIYRRLAETAVLHREDGAGLWRDPDLQIALTWRDQSKPNETWAQRYHPEFDLAMSFLDQSVAARDAQIASDEARRRREIKRTRLTALIFAVASLFSLAMGVYAYGKKNTAEAALFEAQRQRGIAQDAQGRAEIDRLSAKKAEGIAAAGYAAADKERIRAEAQTLLAQDSAKKAEQERDNARRLQVEKQDQATTYGYFKSAFDDLAANNYDQAAASLEKALQYFTKKGDTKNVLSTHINIGDVYRDAYRAEEDRSLSTSGSNATDNYDKAIELIKAGHGDEKRLTSTLEKAGSVFAESRDAEERQQAAAYYEQAAAIYGALGQKDNQVARLIDVGKVFSRWDDEDNVAKAKEAFDHAIRVYRGPVDQNKIAETNIAIGEHYKKILEKEKPQDDEDDDTNTAGAKPAATPTPAPSGGDEQDSTGVRPQNRRSNHENRLRSTAADYFNAAAVEYDSLPAPEKAAEMFTRAGTVLGDSERASLKDEAGTYFRKAASEYGRINNKKKQTEALISGGDVFREADDKQLLEKAIPYDHEAINIYRAAGDKDNEADTLDTIARSYGGSESPIQKQKALEYFEQAAAIYKETQDKSKEVQELLRAAGVVETLEDENAQRQAAAFYDRAVAVYDDDFTRQVATLIRIGRPFVRTTNEARAAKADKYFKDAVALALKKGGSKAAAAAYMDVGSAYSSYRKFPLAVDYFAKARSFYQEDNDLLGQGMALYRLAIAKNGIPGMKAEAPALADQSLALLGQVLPGMATSPDRKALAEGYYVTASLFQFIKKDKDQALANYKIALDIYEKIPGYQKNLSLRTRVTTIRRSIQQLSKPSGD